MGFKLIMNLDTTRRVWHRLFLVGISLGCFQPWLAGAVDLLWKPDQTTYETYLKTTVVEGRKVNPTNPFDTDNYVSYTNHQFSYTPLTSTISNSGWFNSSDSRFGYSRGAATVKELDLFVYSSAYSSYDHTTSAAVGVTTFSSPIDQVIPFEIRASGSLVVYTEGFISLMDVTANRPLWYQHWGFWDAKTIQGFGVSRPEPFLTYDYDHWFSMYTTDPRQTITLIQATQLLQDHDYRLVMYAQGSANSDSEAVHLTVIVPEPTTLSLVGLGVLLPILRRVRSGRRE